MRHPGVLLFCILPILLLLAATLLVVFFGKALADSTVLFGLVPSLWVFVPLVSLFSIAVFIAHFEHSVPPVAAWISIFATASLTIALFAGLHASIGVMCTAPACPSSAFSVSIDDPGLNTPLGMTSAELEALDDGAEAVVKIDRSFSSALYFSTVTFTTLGYGDLQPLPRAKLLAAYEAIIGYVFLGLLVGSAIDYLGQRKTPRGRDVKQTRSWRL